MKLSKSLDLVAIVGMLIPAPAALAFHGNENPPGPKAEKPRVEKDQHKSERARSVPEPATIGLLGAAAGVAGARKLWQRRRRSGSL